VYSVALRPVFFRVSGEITVSAWGSMQERHEHVIITATGTHMRQPAAYEFARSVEDCIAAETLPDTRNPPPSFLEKRECTTRVFS